MAYPTLEELAARDGPVDVNEFGLKTEGLIELIRAIPKFQEIVDGRPILEYEVPEGFAVPETGDLLDSNLRESYGVLTENEDILGILVRSSYKKEMPGEFVSLHTIFNSEDPEGSYQEFKAAVELVREDPRKGVVVQVIPDSVTTVGDKDDQKNPERRVIGYNLTGILARSQGYLDPNERVVNCCFGLPTKLVENPDEIFIIANRDGEWQMPISTGNDYGRGWAFEYVQSQMDVLDVTTGSIIRVSPEHIRCGAWEKQKVPRGVTKHLWGIVQMLEYFESEFGVPVEIEGVADHVLGDLNLVQLTKSHNLENVMENLTTVDESRLLYQEAEYVRGSINFTGDVVILNDNTGDEDNKNEAFRALCATENDVLLISSRYLDDIYDLGFNDYILAGNEQKLRPLYFSSQTSNYLTHTLGFLTAQIYQRNLRGHNMCGILREIGLSELAAKEDGDRVTVDHDRQIAVLKDVTVEATKGKMQIFLN
ncbi:hypothetical protein ACFL1B_02130 [Nanoarchaeota archaeon]